MPIPIKNAAEAIASLPPPEKEHPANFGLIFHHDDPAHPVLTCGTFSSPAGEVFQCECPCNGVGYLTEGECTVEAVSPDGKPQTLKAGDLVQVHIGVLYKLTVVSHIKGIYVLQLPAEVDLKKHMSRV